MKFYIENRNRRFARIIERNIKYRIWRTKYDIKKLFRLPSKLIKDYKRYLFWEKDWKKEEKFLVERITIELYDWKDGHYTLRSRCKNAIQEKEIKDFLEYFIMWMHPEEYTRGTINGHYKPFNWKTEEK
jgi:hypothetical protein